MDGHPEEKFADEHKKPLGVFLWFDHWNASHQKDKDPLATCVIFHTRQYFMNYYWQVPEKVEEPTNLIWALKLHQP